MVSLTSLAEGWPEAVRQELVQLNLVDAKSGVADRGRRARAQAGPSRFYLENLAFLDQARAPAGRLRP